MNATDVRAAIYAARDTLHAAADMLCWDYIGGERTGARPLARARLLRARQQIDAVLDTMHDEMQAEAYADCSRRFVRDGVRGCACCGLDCERLSGGLCALCVIRGHKP